MNDMESEFRALVERAKAICAGESLLEDGQDTHKEGVAYMIRQIELLLPTVGKSPLPEHIVGSKSLKVLIEYMQSNSITKMTINYNGSGDDFEGLEINADGQELDDDGCRSAAYDLVDDLVNGFEDGEGGGGDIDIEIGEKAKVEWVHYDYRVEEITALDLAGEVELENTDA